MSKYNASSLELFDALALLCAHLERQNSKEHLYQHLSHDTGRGTPLGRPSKKLFLRIFLAPQGLQDPIVMGVGGVWWTLSHPEGAGVGPGCRPARRHVSGNPGEGEFHENQRDSLQRAEVLPQKAGAGASR